MAMESGSEGALDAKAIVQRPGDGSSGARVQRVLRNFNRTNPLDIYTHWLSVAPIEANRWHRDVQLLAVRRIGGSEMIHVGCTEIENLISLNGFGETECEWVGLTEKRPEGFGVQSLSDR